MSLSFSACKNKKKNNDNSNNNNDDTPSPGITEVYSVHFDYNLPEDYSYLLADKTIKNKLLGSKTALESVANSKLKDWFLGWSYLGSSEILTVENVSSDSATTIELKGNWDEANLRKYYYSDGLSFEIDDSNVAVSGYSGQSKTVIIPEVYSSGEKEYKINEIKGNIFRNVSIEKVVLNAKNVEIGDNAFQNTNISSFDFEGVTIVGDNAFSGTKLQEIKFGDSLTKVGNYAFKNCEKLNSVDFGSSPAKIFVGAFYGDQNLKTVCNAEMITEVGKQAFYDCSSLENVEFFGLKLTSLGEQVFGNCSNIKTAKIPRTVVTIGGDLFYNCTSLHTLTIFNLYLRDVLNEEKKFTVYFGDISSSLKNLTLDENLDNPIKAIPMYYFENLSNLETISMCNSIETISSYAFKNCSNLKTITLPENLNLDNFSMDAFSDTKFLKELSEPFVYKKSLLFVPKTIAENYEFDDVEVEKICNNVFYGNSSLKTIKIPSTVNFIGNSAFCGCTNLEKVEFELNSSLTNLSSSVFEGCLKLSDVNIENLTALETIGSNAFRNTAITSIKIPSTVTTIETSVFRGTNLTEFKIEKIGDTESNFSVIDGVLYKNLTEGKLKLICYPAYKEGAMFSCPENVTQVCSYAFSDAKNLTSVIFKQAITWDVAKDGMGVVLNCQAFAGLVSINIFAESVDFSCNASNATTYYYNGNCEFNASASASESAVVLGEGFVTTKTNLYFKFTDTQNEKVYFICFKVTVSEGVYSVVPSSVKKIETNLVG